MTPSHSYFCFGVCDKNGLPAYCDLIQEVGCEIVFISSGLHPAPQNHLAIHGNGKPGLIPVAEVYVRCPRGEYDNVIARLKAKEAAMKVGRK
jgi:hypothetical protein